MKLAAPTISADTADLVQGRTVTCTGQLASISHEEFVNHVERHGGTYCEFRQDSQIDVLVVGQEDLPLTREGCLPPALQGGRAKTVITEEQFLDALGLVAERENIHRLYTIALLSELLQVSRQRLRSWVRVGLINPVQQTGGVWHFDFRETSSAKTLCNLTRSGVSTGRIRETLDQLRHWLPEAEQPLQQLALLERDGQLLVRLEDGDLAEPDGQLRLEFLSGEDLSPLRIAPDGPATPAQWAAQGVEQEQAGDLAEAAVSYRQALLFGGPDARICFDLAHVLHQMGQHQAAVERYRQAVEMDPQFAEAWNNLGAALAELQEGEAACVAFQQALAICPDDARAHYNLADLLDDLGQWPEAAEHWRAFLRHDSSSQWAAHARRRLNSQ